MRLKRYLSENIEGRPGEEIVPILFSDCKYYFDLVGIKKEADLNYKAIKFYRSDKRYNDEAHGIAKLERKDNRVSIGTGMLLSHTVNEWLRKTGKVPRDSCVSATANLWHADGFSSNSRNIGVILPIGSFNYTFVKAKDFNYDKTEFVSGGDTTALVGLLKDKLIEAYPTNKIIGYGSDYNKKLIDIMNKRPWLKKKDKIGVSSLRTVAKDADTGENGDKRAKQVESMFVTNRNIKEAYDNHYEIGFSCKQYYLISDSVFEN